MIFRTLIACSVFLLPASILSGQVGKRTVRLPAPADSSEPVHLRNNGYVLTIRRSDLMEPFSAYSWKDSCSILLPVNDTIDLYRTGVSIGQLAVRNGQEYGLFFDRITHCLDNKQAAVYSPAAHAYLKRLHRTEDTSGQGFAGIFWFFRDPKAADAIVFLTGKATIGCPNF